MPARQFALILIAALLAAVTTVWALSLGDPGLWAAALPAALLATVAIGARQR